MRLRRDRTFMHSAPDSLRSIPFDICPNAGRSGFVLTISLGVSCLRRIPTHATNRLGTGATRRNVNVLWLVAPPWDGGTIAVYRH